MITDKEYPATHSMATAWFAIDLDGNVGILDFNENGPVPDGIPDTGVDYILMDTMSDKHDSIKTLLILYMQLSFRVVSYIFAYS